MTDTTPVYAQLASHYGYYSKEHSFLVMRNSDKFYGSDEEASFWLKSLKILAETGTEPNC